MTANTLKQSATLEMRVKVKYIIYHYYHHYYGTNCGKSTFDSQLTQQTQHVQVKKQLPNSRDKEQTEKG